MEKQHFNRPDKRLSSLERSVKVSRNVVFQDVGTDTVLLDTNAGCYYALNRVGSRMWELLVEKENLLAAFESMLEEYEVTREALKPDILRLVQELQAKGLVEVEERV